MIEVQCTSCHTRYRIDEQVLPEGLPTFKCSRCGHVFTFEPRRSRQSGQAESATPKAGVLSELPVESSAFATERPDGQRAAASAIGRPSRELPSPSGNLMASPNPEMQEPANADDARFRSISDPIVDEEPAGPPEPHSELQPSQIRPHSPVMTAAPQVASSPQPRTTPGGKPDSSSISVKDPEADSGENLAFDFADEEPALDRARVIRRGRRQGHPREPSPGEATRWEVGDGDSIVAGDNAPRGEEPLTRASRRDKQACDDDPQFTDDPSFVEEDEAPVYNRAITHSARFFLLAILVVGAGFGALTLVIRNAPASSSVVLSHLPLVGDRFVIPATPAKLVALRGVSALYQHSKEGQNTLVISGTAENVGSQSLRVVQLTAALRDGQRRALASQAVYCGNSVSKGMIGQMTPHEIQFFQRLEPARSFALEPAGSCRFVAVFMNPPGTAHGYDVSVSQAVPGTAPMAQDAAP